jgi:hypothetical protein
MYGMKRTTVYFPEELKARLEEEATRRGVSEAELIREAVDKEVRRGRLTGGIFTGGGLDARDIDSGEQSGDAMEGFGRD